MIGVYYTTLLVVGVAHKIPWEAFATAKDSYNPLIHGDGDELEEETDEIGNTFKLLKDWSLPPVALRCKCQKVNKMCSCGFGPQPQGVMLQLYWDKINLKNR